MKKKVFSRSMAWILSVVMMLSLFMGSSVSVSAYNKIDGHPEFDPDIAVANLIINTNNESAAVEEDTLFFKISQESPATILANEFKKDKDFLNSVKAWEITTFSPSEEVEDALSDVDYYESIILSALKINTNSNFVSSVFNNDYIKDAKSLFNNFKSNLKLVYGIEFWDDVSIEELKANQFKKLSDNFDEAFKKTYPNISKTGKYVSFFSKAVKIGQSIEKAINNTAAYCACCEMTDSLKYMVQQLYLKADSNNFALHSALQKIWYACESYEAASEVADYDIMNRSLNMIYSEITDKIVDSVLSVSPVGVAILLGQGVGKGTANFLFNTKSIVEQYYHLNAFSEFELLVKDVTLDAIDSYAKNPTSENANRLFSAIDMLYANYSDGCDAAKKMYDLIYKDNKYMQMLSIVDKTVNGNYEKAVESINNLKRYNQEAYEVVRINSYHYILMTDYPEACDDMIKAGEIGTPYPEFGQKYWVIFKEGSRNNEIEMSTCYADADKNLWIKWENDKKLTLQGSQIKGRVNQYYLTYSNSWYKFGTYTIFSGNATNVLASNLDVYDSDGNLIVKASNFYDTKDRDGSYIYNGHKYQVFNNCTTWEEAKKYCEGLGGYLAVINNKSENTALYNYIKESGYESAYFGYTDSETEGVWKWVDNHSSSFVNWATGEPNNENSSEDYAMFYYKFSDGTWNDGDFNGRTVRDTSTFICEWDSTNSKALSNLSTISSNSIKLGETVTVRAKATGGVGTKKYAVWYKKSTTSTWTKARDYAAGTIIAFTPKHTGKYNVSVKVKDAKGTIIKKSLTVNVADVLANTSTLSASKIVKGKSVTVNASSTGGIGTKKYAVWYKKSTASTWTKARDYAAGTAITFTPKHTGKYNVSVKVKDANGTIKKKALTVTVNDVLKNTSTLSATTITKGKSVTVNASSTGGIGTKKYAVWYKKSTATDWTQAQNYATNTSVSIKPNYTGTYDISVKVKDENGTIVKKALTIKVNAALKNTSTLSSGSIKKGSSVRVNCSSTGGIGTKKYAVWYKKSTAADWTQAQNYATNTSVSIKPNYTGTYDISVKVKDGDGTIVKKALTVKVTA